MPAERAEYPIKMMARFLGVSRSGSCSRPAGSRPEDGWSAEREAVRRVRLEPGRRFGSRFAKCFLPAEFSGSTLHRARKLMREPGIRGCTPNAEKRTAIPDPNAKPGPDLVRRDLAGPVPACRPVGDITCLRADDVRLSCSRTGSCCDDAVAEPFFAALENEMHCRRSFPTRDSAEHAAIELIEACCNRRRPRSTIGCKVPAEAMGEFFERTAPKPEDIPMAA